MKDWKTYIIVVLICATAFFALIATVIDKTAKEQSAQIAELTNQLDAQKAWNKQLEADNKTLRAETKQLQTQLDGMKSNTVYIVYDSNVYHKDKNCKLILSLYNPVPEEENYVLLRGYEPCFACCRKK